ncbi:MAG: outer membrane protein assembly complex, YaeT protein, partial [Pedosphaera sp.]|nr:outer membrane protein assembly complex, YaeT protein [Pedosphaera sp.]
TWYFKGFAPGHVLEVGGKIGVIQKLSSQDAPFFDRFYLGGQSDLRGYDYRAVGPREVTQDGQTYEPIGGDTYWFGSIEYSVPIITRLRFAMFYDIGNVSAKPFNFGSTPVFGKSFLGGVPPLNQVNPQTFLAGNTGIYSDNWGFGLRIDLGQLGPLRLDYGIPIKHDQFSSSSGKFQFSAGFSRPF